MIYLLSSLSLYLPETPAWSWPAASSPQGRNFSAWAPQSGQQTTPSPPGCSAGWFPLTGGRSRPLPDRPGPPPVKPPPSQSAADLRRHVQWAMTSGYTHMTELTAWKENIGEKITEQGRARTFSLLQENICFWYEHSKLKILHLWQSFNSENHRDNHTLKDLDLFPKRGGTNKMF